MSTTIRIVIESLVLWPSQTRFLFKILLNFSIVVRWSHVDVPIRNLPELSVLHLWCCLRLTGIWSCSLGKVLVSLRGWIVRYLILIVHWLSSPLRHRPVHQIWFCTEDVMFANVPFKWPFCIPQLIVFSREVFHLNSCETHGVTNIANEIGPVIHEVLHIHSNVFTMSKLRLLPIITRVLRPVRLHLPQRSCCPLYLIGCLLVLLRKVRVDLSQLLHPLPFVLNFKSMWRVVHHCLILLWLVQDVLNQNWKFLLLVFAKSWAGVHESVWTVAVEQVLFLF